VHKLRQPLPNLPPSVAAHKPAHPPQASGCLRLQIPNATGSYAGNASRAGSSSLAGQRKARPGHGSHGTATACASKPPTPASRKFWKTCPQPLAQRWKDSTPISESLAFTDPARRATCSSQLLQGSGYNVLLVGDQGQGTPREIVLSSRHAGSTVQAANAPGQRQRRRQLTRRSSHSRSRVDRPFRPASQPGGPRAPRSRCRRLQQQMMQRQQQVQQPGQPASNSPN